jgi:hypothetical protein
MESTCPSCGNQVTHEDHLFEVVCTCGTRFNPFYQMGDLPALDPSTPPVEGASDLSLENFDQDYSESNNAFQELRDFGEGVPSASPGPSATQAKTKQSTEFSDPSAEPTQSIERRFTSGATFEGFRIESYFEIISLWGELTEGPEPLKASLKSLWDLTLARGANGVVDFRWALSPEGTRVLLTGTPVRCAKN